MRWLVKRLAILFLFSTVIVVAATLVGRVITPIWRFSSQQFDLCKGKLCFMGIEPGKTMLADVKQQLVSYRTSEGDGYFLGETGDLEFYAEAATNDTTAPPGSIQVMSKQGGLLPFGYIVERFGTPCYITSVMARTSVAEYLFTFAYPAFSLSVALEGNRVNLSSPVYQIDIYDRLGLWAPGVSCDPTLSSMMMRWLGFTSLEHYREYAAF
jgi:hypothetical protein